MHGSYRHKALSLIPNVLEESLANNMGVHVKVFIIFNLTVLRIPAQDSLSPLEVDIKIYEVKLVNRTHFYSVYEEIYCV